MIKAGVIGHPLSHTLSPKIHQYWFNQQNIDGEYHAIAISPDDLKNQFYRLREDGYRGLNVTLPHKEIVASLCTSLSKDAQIIGAVNAVIFHPSGEIEGHNHDAYGFITHARQTVPNLNIQHAMVMGAGGAARAVIFALRQFGVSDIIITNRSLDRAEQLAEEFNARVVEWDQKDSYIHSIDFLINTTSCGMMGQPPLDISLQSATSELIVYDIVYKPLITPLLSQAQNQNLRIITGLGMLLHQAAPAFRQFFGREVQVDHALEQMILHELTK